jgi:hypothetical protein
MAVLTILIVLLPITSHDYRLTYLFVPMLMYLAASKTTRYDLFIVVFWGLLLVPKNYYALWVPPQNIGMVINPLLLIGLLVCIIPEAFSMTAVPTTLRFLGVRLHSIWPHRRLKDLRSN